MGVDGRVSRCAGEVLVLPIWDVQVGLRVPKLLREAEIDDVDLVSTLSNTHQEVIGLDITVNEVARMDVLDAGDLRRPVSIRLTRAEYQDDVPADQPKGAQS